jgi:4-amino-4-deoxy-L-arabinose transferase-like glycosyltransferase
MTDSARRIRAWLHREALLVAVLVGSFIARWLLADRNSYWVDELYSVAVYGTWNDGAIAAVRQLAENSVHPPIYQFVLYHWMSLFGDSEVATRTLSNLFITLATLFLYLMMRDVFSRRIALASAIVFVLLYSPLYYALEARSYAQTVFLVTLSSYLVARLIQRGVEAGWRAAIRSPAAVVFSLVNVALLLTHYYNGFFWAAQALIVAILLMAERPRRWLPAMGAMAALYIAQGAIFGIIWGRVLVDDFSRRADAYPVVDDVAGPDDLLLDQVITPNIDPPRMIGWALIALAAVLIARSAIGLVRSGSAPDVRRRAWSVLYLAGWMILPLVIVSIAFAVVDFERYNLRYFLYCVVPLAPLLVLTIDDAARHVTKGWAWLTGRDGAATALSTVGTVAVVITLIIPHTYGAATARKADWRGNVARVVDVIEGDETARYAVWEASHRAESLADYYFERFSADVRVDSVLDIHDERTDGHPILAADAATGRDHLIVLFPHLTTDDFPGALAALESRYDVRHRQLDSVGRGFIVFDLAR